MSLCLIKYLDHGLTQQLILKDSQVVDFQIPGIDLICLSATEERNHWSDNGNRRYMA